MKMDHVVSDRIGDFSALFGDVELISVRHPTASSQPLASLAADWLARGDSMEAQWAQSVHTPEVAQEPLRKLPGADLRAALSAEIATGVEVLTDLLNCRSVGVRVATLDGPMCPRFHVDMVPCRMLITLAGQGTEWIAHGDVDAERFADRGADRVPLRDGGSVRSLDAGAWSLLKGGRWDSRFDGVVHRSPHGSGRRLFLSFDPVFSA